MFDIYIKDFNRNGSIISEETLLQSIPANKEGELKLINPIVKNEMGAAESFDFNIESGKKFYDAFKQMKTFIRIVYDGTTIFYGRVITIDNNGFRGTRRIRCEGPIAFLLDSPVEGVEETARPQITTLAYMQKLIANHNSYINGEQNKMFMLGEVPGQYSSDISSAQKIKNDSKKYGSDSWTDTKSALEDLRSHYGGYFRTRLKGSIGSGVYLDWMDQYFNKSKIKQTVKVGKNILDINNVTELDNIFTAIIPIGRRITSTNTSGTSSSTTGSSRQVNLYLDGKVLRVPDIVSKYGDELNFGYHTKADYQNAVKKYGTIIKTVTFQEADTKEKLYNAACEWIKNNYQGEVLKFTIKAIDMHMIRNNTSKIMVGDRVEIIYPVGDEKGNFKEVSTIQTCLSISFDLYHPENNSYTFGVPANILTKTYGVSKQAHSVSSDSTTPKPTGTTSIPQEKKWIDLASGWLMRHHIHYYGTKPWKTSYGESYENASEPYLYEPFAQKLAMATPYRYIIDPVSGREIPIGGSEWYLTDPAAKVKYNYAGMVSYEGAISESLIVKNHVCEWVLQEYGYDLRTQLGVKMSDSITTDDGETTEFSEVIDPETGLPMYVITGFSDAHHTEHYTADGQAIVSMQDENGEWHYYYKDSNGLIHETNIRDLSIAEEKTEDKVGWVVKEKTDGTYDLNPDTMPGQIRLTIEKGIDGEYVVARMSGEMMYLGNKSTRYAKISGDNILFKVNPQDPNSDTVSFAMFRNGVQTSVTKHETVIKNLLGIEGEISIAEGSTTMNNANSIQQVVGQFMTVDDGHGNKTLKIISGGGVEIERNGARFGLWDKGNLTGGIMIDRINDDASSNNKKISGTRISLKASQVIVDNSETHNVLEWMTGLGGDVDTYIGLITPALTTLQATVKDLKTDKLEAADLDADLINSKFGSSATFKAGAIETGSLIYKYGTPSGTDSFSFGNLIKNLKIVQNGNSYTLKYLKVSAPDDDSNYITVGSFSRAVTSWNKGWSNGVLTITPIPQATPSFKVGIGKKWNTDNVDLEVISNGAAKRHKDSSNNYVAGQIECPVVLNELTGSQPNSVYEKDVTFSVSSILETITTAKVGASAKTFTPSEEYIGIGSITVTPTHSAPSGTAIGAHDIKATGISITADGKSATAKMEKETFKPTGSTSNVRGVKLTLGSNIIGRIDTNDYYTEGVNSVKLGAKTISSNGTYKASSDSLNGYSTVTVDVPASSGTISLTTGGSSYWGYNLTSIAYAMGTSDSNLVRIFDSTSIVYGRYYGFKVTCGSSPAKYYYFQT